MQGGTWWDVDGPARILHRLTDLRLEFLASLTDIRDKSVLDLGCGGGIFSQAMCRKGANVTGVDTCTDALVEARAQAVKNSLDIQYVHAHEKNKLQLHSFDLLVVMEVLEHVSCVFETLRDWTAYVKPGGYIIGSTLNRTPLSYLKSIIIAEHVLKWIPLGTHAWHSFITPSELKKICFQVGCIGWVEQGYGYCPFRTPAWNFSRSKDTNFFFATRKQ